MPISTLKIRGLGPIADVRLEPGDLTVLVGPQASGKSLILQTLKAVEDVEAIVEVLKKHGYHWQDDTGALVELLYGEGMRSLFHDKTVIEANQRAWNLTRVAQQSWSKRARRGARVFYVPAQRVLTIQEGWPRPFTAFDVGAPYVVKQFSEDLRRLLEEGLGGDELFPAERRWKKEIRDLVGDAIFHESKVRVDRSQLRKRVVLEVGADTVLPFMSWSAGQREFIPLMLGLYWLMPSQATPRRQNLEWAIIEEPEMGLHPQAITAFSLAIMDLLKRGYRVVLSTHSPHLLELVWALGRLRQMDHFLERFMELFSVRPNRALEDLAGQVQQKTFKVYYLSHTERGVVSKDISSLDPASEDADVAGWGGLTDFAERAADVVARATSSA